MPPTQWLQGPWPMRFDVFMQNALYHPKFGYYSQGQGIFGAEGDFITAPMLSPVFGETIAQAIATLLPSCQRRIIEFGAGTGQLAHDIMSVLHDDVDEYIIIELSAGLAALQLKTISKLPELAQQKIKWLKALPESLIGIVLANEVLDAMPVRRFRFQSHANSNANSNAIEEMWVNLKDDGELEALWCDADDRLMHYAQQLNQAYGPWPNGFESEWAEQSQAWVKTICQRLQGLLLLIDYGYEGQQHYHFSRSCGTVQATFKHTAHADVLARPGQQDITAHVDFSCVWHAAEEAGAALEGYITQAHFLLGHGILEIAGRNPVLTEPVKGALLRQALDTLLGVHAMGETFKVMALSKNIESDQIIHWNDFLQPFIAHDRSGML